MTGSYSQIGLFALCVSLGSAQLAHANNEPLNCQSPYKGQTLSYIKVVPIIKAHQDWLKSGADPAQANQTNLCGTILNGINLANQDLSTMNFAGADLTHANLENTNLEKAHLEKVYLRWANLKQANLQNANMQGAILADTHAENMNIRSANLTQANLQNADFTAADLSGVNLTQATLTDANLTNAQAEYANFNSASLDGVKATNTSFAYSNFTQANLTEADLTLASLKSANLTQANLTGVKLTNTNFEMSDLNSSIFQPALGQLPDLPALATAYHFKTVISPGQRGNSYLVQLRFAFGDIGNYFMERKITSMLKYNEMQNQWLQGGLSRATAVINFLLFYVTVDFGAAPARAIYILLCFIVIFSIPYLMALFIQSKKHGVRITWPANQKIVHHKAIRPIEQIVLTKHLQIPFFIHEHSFSKNLINFINAIKIAFFFSLMSTFRLGWHELNVGNWFARLQWREYTLLPSGWVRTVSGLQSIISAYLIVIWALSYFGHPFNW